MSATILVGILWGWGLGDVGAILDAVDKRFAAFVFMSGPQSTKQYVLSSSGMLALRKTADTAKVAQWKRV
jgi:hypothetical protein